MPGKRRHQPDPSIPADRVAESPESAGAKAATGTSPVRYDPDELFPDAPRLSERERETLEMLGDGKSNGVIATALGNSKRTVEDFIAQVVKKLDVADRNEAMAAYHQAIEAKLERENKELIAENRALREQIAALRRQLRQRP